MSTVSVRRATAGDAAALAPLCDQLGYPSEGAAVAARLGDILPRDDHAVFLVEGEGGAVVAWAHVFLARHVESDPFAELGGLVVAETGRGQGLGGTLLAAAEAWSRAQGVTKLRVRSRTERTEAHRFYLERGFSRTKTQGVFDRSLG